MTGLWALAAFFVLQYLARRLISHLLYEVGAYSRECAPPPALPSWDPLFNIDCIFTNLRARVEHRVLRLDQENLSKHGHTLRNPFFGRGAIQTTSHENYMAIMSIKSNNDFVADRDWAMQPMAGRGIIDTDGSEWAFHHRLAKTAFARAQINDPESFGVHFERMMQQRPKDGSTVDLRPILDRMNMDAQSEFYFGESVETLLRGTFYRSRLY